MTAPAPVIAQPDAEAWAWENLRHLPGVTVFAYAAGTTWPNWVWSHFLQVDARAKTKKRARDLAETARQIIAALPDRQWADGAVCYAQPVEGPFWLPGDDGGPRYCARYEVRAHPVRQVPTAARAVAAATRGPGTAPPPARAADPEE